MLETKASINTRIKENLISNCPKFLVVVVAIINQHVLVTTPVLQSNAAYKMQ